MKPKKQKQRGAAKQQAVSGRGSKKSRFKAQKADPAQDARNHAVVRGDKFSWKPGDAEVEVPAQHCQCGDVTTDQPLAMCVTCPECGEWLHTKSDAARHDRCGEVIEVAEAPLLTEAPATARKATKKRQALPAARASEAGPDDLPGPALPRRSAWELFFACQRNPVVRSQLITGLMAGTKLQFERVPTVALLDAVLLCTAAREFCAAEIIDDYEELLSRTKAEWERPEHTHRDFDSQHGRWAGCIVFHGARDFETPEERYVPGFVSWLLSQDAPEYFVRELDDEVAKKRRAA